MPRVPTTAAQGATPKVTIDSLFATAPSPPPSLSLAAKAAREMGSKQLGRRVARGGYGDFFPNAAVKSGVAT